MPQDKLNRYKLSIVIPTYNRAVCVRECLDSVFESVTGFEDLVEIVVSDNHSQDFTEAVARQYFNRKPAFRYIQPPTAIPAEVHFRFVAAAAVGEYVWILGDDDKIEKRAVPEILSKMEASREVLFLNFSVWDKNVTRLITPRYYNLRADILFTRPDDFLKRFGLTVGLISAVVIKREAFFRLPEQEYLKYVEYGFPFMYAVYFSLLPAGIAYFISDPVLVNRAGNSGGYDWYKFFVSGSSLIFEELHEKGYSAESVACAKYSVLTEYLLKTILVHRRDGRNLGGEWRRLFSSYRGSAKFWALIVPAFFVPRFVIVAFWAIYKRFRFLRRVWRGMVLVVA